jgi:sugar phosphate isomerase/epimerase
MSSTLEKHMTMTDRRTILLGACGAAASLAFSAAARGATGRPFFQRIGRPIGLQLYTLGDAPKTDLEGTLKRVAQIGYRDIELPGLLGLEPAAIRRVADAQGLKISSIHIGTSATPSIHEDAGRLADIANTLGAKQIVVPMFPTPAGFKAPAGETFGAAIQRHISASGEDFWKQLARLLNERAAALKPHGIALGYHTHNPEFTKVGERTGWEILAAETDHALVHFEADIGWIVSAGLDPVAFLKRYAGRVRQLHVKDVKKGVAPNTRLETDPTEVGSGVVDWKRVLPAAYAAGVRNFYVEQEPPFAIPRIDAAAKCFDYLARLVA